MSNDPTLFSESVSGRTQARKVSGQRWELKAKYPPMTQADFMPVYAYVVSQRGRLNTFTVRIPVLEDARGTASGTFSVNGAKTAGQTVISIDGGSGTLVEGDFIKFAHDKVYMVVAHSETSGNTRSITVSPALVVSIADNSSITYDNVPIKVRLKRDVQQFNMSNDSMFRYELDFIEAL
jgi:hypothetical protein